MFKKYLQELQTLLAAPLSPAALLASSRACISIHNAMLAHSLDDHRANRQKRIDLMAQLRRQCLRLLLMPSLDCDARIIAATALLMLQFAPAMSIVDDKRENEALRMAWKVLDDCHPSGSAASTCADVELLDALASQDPDAIEHLLRDTITTLQATTLAGRLHVKLLCRAVDLATLCGFASADGLDTVRRHMAAAQCTTPEQKLQLDSCRIATACMTATQAIATTLPA